jgi:hypothetical protein
MEPAAAPDNRQASRVYRVNVPRIFHRHVHCAQQMGFLNWPSTDFYAALTSPGTSRVHSGSRIEWFRPFQCRKLEALSARDKTLTVMTSRRLKV